MTSAALAKNKEPVTYITAAAVPAQAFIDLRDGVRLYELWSRLALHDIRQRFRRSVLGPIWLTISMGIMITALGVVFSSLFRQEAAKTMPYIATGIIFWGLLTNCITEGTMVFISAESFIRNVPVPISLHVYRMIARNLIIWCFNMAIYVLVVIYFGVPTTLHTLLFVPGFLLFIVNTSWLSLSAGVLSTRYRDVPQVIANVMQVIFFLTPIFWSPESLPTRTAFVEFNPFYHMVEIVRLPLLGEAPTLTNWGVCVGMAMAGTGFAAWLFRRAHARIAYWV